MVSHPACDVAGIFGQKLKLAGVDVAPVDVKDFGVSLVHVDEHVNRVIFEVVEYPCPDFLEWRQVSGLASLDVSDVYVKIFVAA